MKSIGALVAFWAVCLAGGIASADSLPLASAQPANLPTTEYALAPEGTTVTWRDLDSGDTLEEDVGKSEGLMMKSRIGSHRSYAYLPDPWADNENTRQDDIVPLFPLAVGKKVEFSRHPEAGLAHDTVEVVRAETLSLPLGKVDTFVVQTHSEIASDNWKGTATFWYAPSLHWYVQLEIKDSEGDGRRRQMISISKPGVE